MGMPNKKGELHCKKCGELIGKFPKGIICVAHVDYCEKCRGEKNDT